MSDTFFISVADELVSRTTPPPKKKSKMTLQILQSLEIIEIMENYIYQVRPLVEIRSQLDLSYELKDQSVILNQIRPFWNNPKEILTLGFAKATFDKTKNKWKIYWKRSDGKWHTYKPQPVVDKLEYFLDIVDEDKYHCFKA